MHKLLSRRKAFPVVLTADKDSTAPVQQQEVKTFLKDNIFKIAWTGVLSLGGLFALIFFGHIGYLPEFDLGSATAFLASIALIGLFLAAAFMVNLMLGGWALLFTVTEFDAKPSWWQLLVSAGVALGLLVIGIIWKDWLTYILVVASIGLVLGFAILLVRAGLTGKTSNPDHEVQQKRSYPRWVVWIRSRPCIQKFIDSYACPFAGVFNLTCLWVVACAVATLPFAVLCQGTQRDELLILVIWWVWVIVSSWLVWNPSFKTPRPATMFLAVGAASLVVLTILSYNFSAIPVAAVKTLSMGKIDGVSLVVNEQGCAILRGVAGEASCKAYKDAKAFVVTPVELKSRLGSQYYVGICVDDEVINVALKKEDVLAWSKPEPKKASETTNTASKKAESKASASNASQTACIATKGRAVDANAQ